MSAHKDGGPAFPVDNIVERDAEGRLHGKDISSAGMSLRDYFAAHAPLPPETMTLQEHCAYRYRYADAMIATRKAGASDQGANNE